MKLSFMRWKRAVSLCLAVVMAFSIVLGQMSHSSAIRLLAGAKNNGAEKASVQYDDKIHYSEIEDITCTPSNITIAVSIWMWDKDMEVTGAEIYRAKIKANGKRGDFKKIGVCRELKQNQYDKYRWDFTYSDSTVKAGQAYVYKCRGFRQVGNVKKLQKEDIRTRKGVAAKSAGKYKCKVVKNTEKKLIVKITGKNKNNGTLERIESGGFKGVYLVFKNKGKEGGAYGDVKLEAFSYNGKKWHKGRLFHIKGKESVYLRFSRSGHDIDMSKYKYVQMMLEYMQYNLSTKKDRPNEMPQLRLNLTSGETLTGQFIKWVDNKWVTEWDGRIFDDAVYEGE